MEKSEFRTLIKHYFLFGKTLSETKAKLNKYYSDSAPSYGMVQKWFTEFRCGRTSTEMIPSPGRTNEIITPEIINKTINKFVNEKALCKIGAAIAHNWHILTAIRKSFSVDLSRWM